MSDFSFSVRCPYCGGRFAPDDGSCCEPPEEEGEEEGGGVGSDYGLGSEPFALTREDDESKKMGVTMSGKGVKFR